jgi:hypothetical protein
MQNFFKIVQTYPLPTGKCLEWGNLYMGRLVFINFTFTFPQNSGSGSQFYFISSHSQLQQVCTEQYEITEQNDSCGGHAGARTLTTISIFVCLFVCLFLSYGRIDWIN